MNTTKVDGTLVSSYFLISISFSISKPIWLNLQALDGGLIYFFFLSLNLMGNPLGYVDK